MKKALPDTDPVKAKAITEANIGPTQGVQIKPKEAPIKSPPPKPLSATFPLFPKLLNNLAAMISKYLFKAGIKRIKPKVNITKTEIFRKKSALKPVNFTIEVKKSVKKVKLKRNPSMIPKGFFLPSLTEPERIIGKTGKIQGERIVTIPAKKAKPIKISILKIGLKKS